MPKQINFNSERTTVVTRNLTVPLDLLNEVLLLITQLTVNVISHMQQMQREVDEFEAIRGLRNLLYFNHLPFTFSTLKPE